MPINKRGGKGHKRGKRMTASQFNTGLTYKDASQNQEYAKVISTLGDCRLSVQLVGVDPTSPMAKQGEQPLLCKIPGSFRKKIFINKGDYVLVSVREYQKDHVDVLTKYNHSEALTLMKQGEIPSDDSGGNNNGDNETNDCAIIFQGEDEAPTVADPKVTKDANWYESLMPPNDSDSENSDNQAPKGVKNVQLNKKGVNMGPVPTNQMKFEIPEGEIDLETL
jgi:translation initiation factor 1A